MELTRKQEEGLKITIDRYRANEKYTVIAGYAGTGKSTLVSFIIDALQLNPEEDVCYIAYTGKAALVLRNKGCQNAITAHKLLFNSVRKPDGTFKHFPKKNIPSYKVIVVDEVSMLPKYLWELLLSHKIYVIALGDPGQLPPVGEDNFILNTPHVFLDQVMRQAQESEIIRLSMLIREGSPIKTMNGNDVKIIESISASRGMYLWADQIIAGKNNTRRDINAMIRTAKGATDARPMENEKIICLRNNWDRVSEGGDVLVNGLTGYLSNIKYDQFNKWLHPGMTANFIPEGYGDADIMTSPFDLYFRDIPMDYKMLVKGEPAITKDNWRTFPKKMELNSFDYGYCITCHKSQGSEYNKVLVQEEYLKGTPEDHKKWLYTACTRAKDKLILIKGR